MVDQYAVKSNEIHPLKGSLVVPKEKGMCQTQTQRF